MDEDKILNVLLNNIQSYDIKGPEHYRNKLIGSLLWLTEESWKLCKYKKMISIQSMSGPAELAFYVKREHDRAVIESKAVAARMLKLPIDFASYSTITEEIKVKNCKLAYTIANEIDNIILAQLPKSNNVMASADYMIIPKSKADVIKPRDNIESFSYDGQDVISGMYPISSLELPIFMPYALAYPYNDSLYLRYGLLTQSDFQFWNFPKGLDNQSTD